MFLSVVDSLSLSSLYELESLYFLSSDGGMFI